MKSQQRKFRGFLGESIKSTTIQEINQVAATEIQVVLGESIKSTTIQEISQIAATEI